MNQKEAAHQAETSEAEQPESWLIKKLIDESTNAFRTVWGLYLQFYTVFLTFNITALGITIQYIHTHQWLIVVAFITQNLLALGTAIGVALFSRASANEFKNLCEFHIERLKVSPLDASHLNRLAKCPLPSGLGLYGGIANAIGHVLMITCWTAVLFLK